jgi:chromate transporter
MMDGLALGETTPGPLIMVLAFVGFMAGYNRTLSVLSGTLGLFLAVWFTFLPSFLFVFIGAPLIERTHNNLRIKYLLEIINAAVVGLILHLTFYLFKTVSISITPPFDPLTIFNLMWIILSLVFLARFKVNIVAWIGISALAGLGYYLAFS